MTYQITWGRGAGQATVITVAELDAVLDRIGPDPDGIAYSVGIIAPPIPSAESGIPPMLDICLGHPTRSFVYHVGADGDSAWGYQPEIPPTAGIYANHGGAVDEAWPERARVTPTTAREAARQFVAHDAQRPTCLYWDTDEVE